MRNNSAARFAGIACLTGGLLFFLDFAVVGWALKTQFLSFSNQSANLTRAILWVGVGLGLTGGAIGLSLCGATGTRWHRKLGICGTVFNLLGAVSYIIGTIFIYNFPDRATKQFFTPLASLLLTIGMLKLAVAVMTAGVWRDWRKFIPLIVGLYFPLQLPLQIVFFLGQGKGPNALLLGFWGVFWAFLGAVIWTKVPRTKAFEFGIEKV